MKLISWNVNGLRACLDKGFIEFFKGIDADIFCVQETKMQQDQAIIDLFGYEQFWNSATKKGYSGTAIFTRIPPLSVTYDYEIDDSFIEGRTITLEFDSFYVVNVYTPNAQRELARLPYRMKWDDDFRNYINRLNDKKPVIICGDFNVAHEEIDLKNPKSNHHNAGFSDEERAKMTALLDTGFTDTFRYLYQDKRDAYTWWSYMFHAREKNVGWRIDYFIVSDCLKENIKDALIYPEITGSDHCPVGLELS